MKDNISIEKKLIFHFPEIINNNTIPVNYQYCRHYTVNNVSSKGFLLKDSEDEFFIEVKPLQSYIQEFYVFYKPISRIFNE